MPPVNLLTTGPIRRPDYVSARLLAANTHEEITVPTVATQAGGTIAADLVLLAGTADFYIAYGAAPVAVIPADADDGTSNELIPYGNQYLRAIPGDAKLSVISAGTCTVTASFFMPG